MFAIRTRVFIEILPSLNIKVTELQTFRSEFHFSNTECMSLSEHTEGLTICLLNVNIMEQNQ